MDTPPFRVTFTLSMTFPPPDRYTTQTKCQTERKEMSSLLKLRLTILFPYVRNLRRILSCHLQEAQCYREKFDSFVDNKITKLTTDSEKENHLAKTTNNL